MPLIGNSASRIGSLPRFLIAWAFLGFFTFRLVPKIKLVPKIRLVPKILALHRR